MGEHEAEARKVGRELGLTDLVVLKTGRHRCGWMVRLPDGVAFRGSEESTSEDGAWLAMGRTLGDLATSARIHLRDLDQAQRELGELHLAHKRARTELNTVRKQRDELRAALERAREVNRG